MLQIYNTRTKQKELFKPLIPGKIGLYVCGVTVYDYGHIGHARTYIAFDNIIRYLKYRNYQVTYVRNITDIDDKIINRANETKEDFHVIVERFIDAMHEDDRALGLAPPTMEPRVTTHLPQIIKLIEKLIDNGVAYQSGHGDVYFSVDTFNQKTQFDQYGALSRQNIEDLIAQDVHEQKHSPLDFALWKASKPGEPSWASPWGAGRPGWHIECSAMSLEHLGGHFDLHGGGLDLIFPHHENEVAQSQGAGCPFAQCWMHAGLLQVDGEKMSKSLGNFITIRDALKTTPIEVLRYFVANSHYRSPLNYTHDLLVQSTASLTTLYQALRGLPSAEPLKDSEFEKEFSEAMDDDFNSPKAFVVLFELAKEINRLKLSDFSAAAALGALLRQLANLFGILLLDPEHYFQSASEMTEQDREKIEALIAKRNEARAQKSWAAADAARDELDAMGVVIEDGKGSVKWRIK